ncbi:Efk-1 [Aphelenchoides fujianensis]|nr:Efk-1 [Aphelenchoides fujianensis]
MPWDPDPADLIARHGPDLRGDAADFMERVAEREHLAKHKVEWPPPVTFRDKNEFSNGAASKSKPVTKRLASIREEHGYRASKKQQRLERQQRRELNEALRKVRQKEVKEALAEMKNGRDVDLCFCVDATESMGPHITGVKDAINAIVSGILLMFKRQKERAAKEEGILAKIPTVRLAFVAYRDYGDRPQFQQFAFNESVGEFRQFCGGLKAFGGGDTPEDVMGGLHRAWKLDWSREPATIRVLFHVADAPAHGDHFHLLADDEYPKGDPNKLMPKEIFRKLRRKRIDYYFGRINHTTDKMIEQFGLIRRQPIVEFPITNTAHILDSVITAVRESVSLSSRCSSVGSLSSRLTELQQTIVEEPPDWAACAEHVGKVEKFQLPSSIKSIIDDAKRQKVEKETEMRFLIAPHPFASGAERVVYFGRDLDKRVDVVLKQYRFASANPRERYETANLLQDTAAFMAAEFMKTVEEKLQRSKLPAIIRVVRSKTVFFLAPHSRTPRYFSCEPRLPADQHFVRFTNNADYEMCANRAKAFGVAPKQLELLTAFTHWTFHITKGELMITDLQGVLQPADRSPDRKTTILLTDPAIHAVDLLRFGSTNCGVEGMKEFFKTHHCNSFCQRLELRVPS